MKKISPSLGPDCYIDSMDIYKRAETLYRKLHQPEAQEEAIDLLLQNALQHPDDAKAWFELGGCFDFLGREKDAAEHYERAYKLGVDKLSPTDRPRLFLQWGSTLRNLKRLPESEEILLEGAQLFPEMKALKAFLALTRYSNGDYQKAAQALFILLHSKAPPDDSLGSFSRALDWYIDHLDSEEHASEQC